MMRIAIQALPALAIANASHSFASINGCNREIVDNIYFVELKIHFFTLNHITCLITPLWLFLAQLVLPRIAIISFLAIAIAPAEHILAPVSRKTHRRYLSFIALLKDVSSVARGLLKELGISGDGAF